MKIESMRKMFKTVTFAAVIAISLGLPGSPAGRAEAAGEMPNIVLIYVDDMGYGDTTLSNPNALVSTPNIQSIGTGGVMFTDGYTASPVCSPSRAALLTSREPADFDADNNKLDRTYPENIPAETLADLLHDKGYVSKAIGKWDLAGADGSSTATEINGSSIKPYMPIGRGFDDFWGIPEGISSYFPHGTDANGNPSRYTLWNAWYVVGHGATSQAINDCNTNGCLVDANQRYSAWDYESGSYVQLSNEHRYLANAFTQEAKDYIDERAAQPTTPFFLYLAYNTSHVPYQALDYYYQDFINRTDLNDEQKVYCAMIAALDHYVGEILNELDAQGLSDNTMVVFASDNWPEHAGSPGVLSGGKHTLNEGGIRMPFAIKWPAKYASGKVIGDPISTLDLLPTIAVAAGYSQTTLQSTYQIDGADLTPRITSTDPNPAAPHDALYWRYINDDWADVAANGNLVADTLAVRSGDYKYIRNILGNGLIDEHLYDAATDVGEQSDLFGQSGYETITGDLVAKLNDWDSREPFQDNFDLGNDYGWIKYGGTWDTVDVQLNPPVSESTRSMPAREAVQSQD
jgi:arylsulfatase A-like enzyme